MSRVVVAMTRAMTVFNQDVHALRQTLIAVLAGVPLQIAEQKVRVVEHYGYLNVTGNAHCFNQVLKLRWHAFDEVYFDLTQFYHFRVSCL
jgi:hypothetical protein